MIRPPPTTTTTAATIIASLASECCVQLSREGSGYGRRSGHHVSPTIAPPDNQQSPPPPPPPPPLPPPPLPPSLPPLHTRGIQQTPGGEARIRSGDTKRYGLGSWGRQGPLPAKEVDVRGSQAAIVRWLRWVRKETWGTVRVSRTRCAPLPHTAAATSPPLPPSLPLRRMLCSPGIEHSRQSQLSCKGSACGVARCQGASR